jgi:hypothetical protein
VAADSAGATIALSGAYYTGNVGSLTAAMTGIRHEGELRPINSTLPHSDAAHQWNGWDRLTRLAARLRGEAVTP